MQYLRYRENRRRGTTDFPFAFYHVTKKHPDYVMQLHWHPEFELIRVLKGTLILHVAHTEYKLKPGCFVLITSNLPHSAVPNDCEYDCIVFDSTILLGKNEESNIVVSRIMEHNINPQCVFEPATPIITNAAWHLFDSFASRTSGYQMIVLGALYIIIGTIMRRGLYTISDKNSEYAFKKSIRFQQAMNYIENSYQKHLTLEEIANSIGMTPKSFCRFFKDMAHCSPIDYLNSYRIDHAGYQLLTTDMTITEVALENGFNDLSYFTKTFKKYKGVTPKQYIQSFTSA